MNKTHHFLFDLLKKYTLKEIMGLIFTLLYTVSVFLVPYISKYLLDNILVLRDVNKLYVWLVLFFITCLFQPLSSYIKDIIFFKISEDMVFSIRSNILKKILFTSMNFLDNTPKGTILSRILNDGRNISDFITNVFVIFIKNAILFFMVFIGMFILSWQISILLILLLAIYILYNFIMSKRFEKLSKNQLADNDVLCENLGNSLDNISLIKTFNLTDFYYDKNLIILKNIHKNNLYISKLRSKFETFSSIVMLFSLSVIYGIGSFLVIKGDVTLGTIFALSLYFQVLVQPVRELINNNIKYREVIPSINRLREYLLLEEEHKNLKNTYNKNFVSKHCVSFENLSFSYVKKNEAVCALQNISFSFENSGIYGIVGQSGSGKSTIAKLILGLYLPCQGDLNIVIDGKSIIDITEIRDNISYASQDMEFLNATIIDNLKIFKTNITDAEVTNVCKVLNLDKIIQRLPTTYFDIINEKINLSGGEKQRFSVARAILKKSPIYIFDEITSSLDKSNESIVYSIIEDLSKNSIVIFITHKVSLLKKSKKIIVLDKGCIVQSGGYNELSIADGVFKNILSKNRIRRK